MRCCKVRARVVDLSILFAVFCSVNQDTRADFVFGEPENLGPVINTAWYEGAGRGFSDNGLSLAFVRIPPGTNHAEGWLATRPSADAPWETPVKQGNVDFETALRDPNIAACFSEFMSPDGLEVYFSDSRPEGLGGYDIWMMTRETKESDWGPVVNLGPPVNTEHDDWQFVLSPDGLELYFCDDTDAPRPGGSGNVDIWVARRESLGAPWGETVNLGPNVNSAAWDSAPYLSPDGLLLFFDSRRSGGYGSFDLYMSRRATLSDPWQEAVNLGPVVCASAYDESPQVSADGSTFYWGSERPGGYGRCDVWQASVIPIVDFNMDGAADCLDICDLVDHWGTNNSLYDIGPTPFGDGVVDVQDLIVLAEHMAAEVDAANTTE
jgi:hypothetical protein